MTHEEIIRNFLIEYDKANVTSSYPSLTEYEIAVVLDKAYLALISQKLTGNNIRRASFESDVKVTEDLLPLVKRNIISREEYATEIETGLRIGHVANEYVYKIPEDMLYLIDGFINTTANEFQNILISSHAVAQKFKETATNMPWITTPVCYLENKHVHVFIDRYAYEKKKGTLDLTISYIKKPKSFVTYVQIPKESIDIIEQYKFELNDVVAEELISLAIIMSLEIVESTRLESKIKTATLES